MKMQIYKFCFILLSVIIFSTLVRAGDVVIQDGKLSLEGEFDILTNENLTTFISEEGSLSINKNLEEIPINNDSLKKANIQYIKENETHQDPSQEKSISITGAVVKSGKSNNYALPMLIILIIIVGLSVFFIKKRN